MLTPDGVEVIAVCVCVCAYVRRWVEWRIQGAFIFALTQTKMPFRVSYLAHIRRLLFRWCVSHGVFFNNVRLMKLLLRETPRP